MGEKNLSEPLFKKAWLDAVERLENWYNQPRSWGDALRCLVGLHRVAQSGWISGTLFSRCSCSAYRIGVGGWHRERFWTGPRKARRP